MCIQPNSPVEAVARHTQSPVQLGDACAEPHAPRRSPRRGAALFAQKTFGPSAVRKAAQSIKKYKRALRRGLFSHNGAIFFGFRYRTPPILRAKCRTVVHLKFFSPLKTDTPQNARVKVILTCRSLRIPHDFSYFLDDLSDFPHSRRPYLIIPLHVFVRKQFSLPEAAAPGRRCPASRRAISDCPSVTA
ncbi:hypothetical protein EVAR_21474_1 [Eumeta japonica]|uniref:Uncharacterized protein n=1 Tax=Eumeta variegata TaxID=151549 RepID=A0A4C1ZQ30_EUMVA|nr:hypothetical protein EVAR_21474_1 [Eumeta japonica]